MNKDINQGKWTQLKAQIQAVGATLTDDVFGCSMKHSEYLARQVAGTIGGGPAIAPERESRGFHPLAALGAASPHPHAAFGDLDVMTTQRAGALRPFRPPEPQ
jgi:hypothetical protein